MKAGDRLKTPDPVDGVVRSGARRMPLLLAIFAISTSSHAAENSHRYVDTPYFGVMPGDSIDDAFKRLGETKRVATPLAHDNLLYYDFVNKTGLVIGVYQANGGKTIWRISIRQEADYKKLYEIISDDVAPQKSVEIGKPTNVTIPKVLTKKGVALGMTIREVESVLKAKLHVSGNEAMTGWDVSRNGGVVDYGGIHFLFSGGKLKGIAWWGVDP